MSDLGKYADTVLAAYGVSLLLLGVLIAFSLWRGRAIRAQMEQIEARAVRDA